MAQSKFCDSLTDVRRHYPYAIVAIKDNDRREFHYIEDLHLARQYADMITAMKQVDADHVEVVYIPSGEVKHSVKV